MRLLLTSAGIMNKSIANTLRELTKKDPGDTKVGFISTAANVETGDKAWFLSQLNRLGQDGYKWIDIIDISAPEVNWGQRLGPVDVIVMSGGNTFYLLDQMRKTGFDEWFKTVGIEKVYVGISAGSIVVTPSIAVAGIEPGDINLPGIIDLTGLGLVDFEVSPHTTEHVSHEANKRYAETTTATLYGLDDQSAIKVMGEKIEVVSEGEWVKYD